MARFVGEVSECEGLNRHLKVLKKEFHRILASFQTELESGEN